MHCQRLSFTVHLNLGNFGGKSRNNGVISLPQTESFIRLLSNQWSLKCKLSPSDGCRDNHDHLHVTEIVIILCFHAFCGKIYCALTFQIERSTNQSTCHFMVKLWQEFKRNKKNARIQTSARHNPYWSSVKKLSFRSSSYILHAVLRQHSYCPSNSASFFGTLWI